jgi:hypothetical protein
MNKENYPSIDGVTFSDHDRKFLQDQAEKHNLLKPLVVLMVGASTALQILSTQIKNGGDLAEYLIDRAVDIKTDNWADGWKYILKIQLNTAINDITYHLQGVYRFQREEKLDAPKGKAVKFFKLLLRYYDDVLSEL